MKKFACILAIILLFTLCGCKEMLKRDSTFVAKTNSSNQNKMESTTMLNKEYDIKDLFFNLETDVEHDMKPYCTFYDEGFNQLDFSTVWENPEFVKYITMTNGDVVKSILWNVDDWFDGICNTKSLKVVADYYEDDYGTDFYGWEDVDKYMRTHELTELEREHILNL